MKTRKEKVIQFRENRSYPFVYYFTAAGFAGSLTLLSFSRVVINALHPLPIGTLIFLLGTIIAIVALKMIEYRKIRRAIAKANVDKYYRMVTDKGGVAFRIKQVLKDIKENSIISNGMAYRMPRGFHANRFKDLLEALDDLLATAKAARRSWNDTKDDINSLVLMQIVNIFGPSSSDHLISSLSILITDFDPEIYVWGKRVDVYEKDGETHLNFND